MEDFERNYRAQVEEEIKGYRIEKLEHDKKERQAQLARESEALRQQIQTDIVDHEKQVGVNQLGNDLVTRTAGSCERKATGRKESQALET